MLKYLLLSFLLACSQLNPSRDPSGVEESVISDKVSFYFYAEHAYLPSSHNIFQKFIYLRGLKLKVEKIDGDAKISCEIIRSPSSLNEKIIIDEFHELSDEALVVSANCHLIEGSFAHYSVQYEIDSRLGSDKYDLEKLNEMRSRLKELLLSRSQLNAGNSTSLDSDLSGKTKQLKLNSSNSFKLKSRLPFAINDIKTNLKYGVFRPIDIAIEGSDNPRIKGDKIEPTFKLGQTLCRYSQSKYVPIMKLKNKDYFSDLECMVNFDTSGMLSSGLLKGELYISGKELDTQAGIQELDKEIAQVEKQVEELSLEAKKREQVYLDNVRPYFKKLMSSLKEKTKQELRSIPGDYCEVAKETKVYKISATPKMGGYVTGEFCADPLKLLNGNYLVVCDGSKKSNNQRNGRISIFSKNLKLIRSKTINFIDPDGVNPSVSAISGFAQVGKNIAISTMDGRILLFDPSLKLISQKKIEGADYGFILKAWREHYFLLSMNDSSNVTLSEFDAKLELINQVQVEEFFGESHLSVIFDELYLITNTGHFYQVENDMRKVDSPLKTAASHVLNFQGHAYFGDEQGNVWQMNSSFKFKKIYEIPYSGETSLNLHTNEDNVIVPVVSFAPVVNDTHLIVHSIDGRVHFLNLRDFKLDKVVKVAQASSDFNFSKFTLNQRDYLSVNSTSYQSILDMNGKLVGLNVFTGAEIFARPQGYGRGWIQGSHKGFHYLYFKEVMIDVGRDGAKVLKMCSP